MIDLSAAGLSKTEAKCYQALLERKSWKPSDLAEYVGETRTNTYKILDKLLDYKLCGRQDDKKTYRYYAANPARLYELARQRRQDIERAEKQLELNAHELTRQFVKTQEQPGVRFFQGKNGIKKVFEDMLIDKQDIYLLRSTADVGFYDEAFFDDFRTRRAKLGIKTHAITPLTKHAISNLEHDISMNFIRTVIPVSSYTGSVEWNVYGDKLAIISYGEDALAMVIESAAIATSFRELYALMASSRLALESSRKDTSLGSDKRSRISS